MLIFSNSPGNSSIDVGEYLRISIGSFTDNGSVMFGQRLYAATPQVSNNRTVTIKITRFFNSHSSPFFPNIENSEFAY